MRPIVAFTLLLVACMLLVTHGQSQQVAGQTHHECLECVAHPLLAPAPLALLLPSVSATYGRSRARVVNAQGLPIRPRAGRVRTVPTPFAVPTHGMHHMDKRVRVVLTDDMPSAYSALNSVATTNSIDVEAASIPTIPAQEPSVEDVAIPADRDERRNSTSDPPATGEYIYDPEKDVSSSSSDLADGLLVSIQGEPSVDKQEPSIDTTTTTVPAAAPRFEPERPIAPPPQDDYEYVDKSPLSAPRWAKEEENERKVPRSPFLSTDPKKPTVWGDKTKDGVDVEDPWCQWKDGAKFCA